MIHPLAAVIYLWQSNLPWLCSHFLSKPLFCPAVFVHPIYQSGFACSCPAKDSTVHAALTPAQTNAYDCGVYVLGKLQPASCLIIFDTAYTVAWQCAQAKLAEPLF